VVGQIELKNTWCLDIYDKSFLFLLIINYVCLRAIEDKESTCFVGCRHSCQHLD